jgi:hypothetical protein
MLANWSRVDDQCGVLYRSLHALFGAGDIRKAFGKPRGSLRMPGHDGCFGTGPVFDRSENGSGRTTGADHDDSRISRLSTEEGASGGIESSDIGVVTMKLVRVDPECIDGADLRRQVSELVAQIVNGDLVRDRHVAGAIGSPQLAKNGAKLATANIERFVNQRDFCRAERGVLKNR